MTETEPSIESIVELISKENRISLSDVFEANPSNLLETPLDRYDLTEVVFGQHALHRLRVRGGMGTETALQLMVKGQIVENRSPEHEGQLMVQYHDHRGVEHEWPLEFHEHGEVLVLTYIAISPFRTQPHYSIRRIIMLQGLEWLSFVLDVPLPLTGSYVAQAIEDFASVNYQLLYCGDLLSVMDVIWSILPTEAEFELLRHIPYASEMGDPESWIMGIGGELVTARRKVALIRRFAWDMHAVEMGPRGRELSG